jgi:hypothetical protein
VVDEWEKREMVVEWEKREMVGECGSKKGDVDGKRRTPRSEAGGQWLEILNIPTIAVDRRQ